MSLNLGTEAIEAARALHQSDAAKMLFEAVRCGVGEQARAAMNRALDCESDRVDDAVGYARAMRDVYLALEAAANGLRPSQVEKPGATEVRRATAR